MGMTSSGRETSAQTKDAHIKASTQCYSISMNKHFWAKRISRFSYNYNIFVLGFFVDEMNKPPEMSG